MKEHIKIRDYLVKLQPLLQKYADQNKDRRPQQVQQAQEEVKFEAQVQPLLLNQDPYIQQVIDQFGFKPEFKFRAEDDEDGLDDVFVDAALTKLIHNLTSYTFDGLNPPPIHVVQKLPMQSLFGMQ